jgi:hypothetical protein
VVSEQWKYVLTFANGARARQRKERENVKTIYLVQTIHRVPSNESVTARDNEIIAAAKRLGGEHGYSESGGADREHGFECADRTKAVEFERWATAHNFNDMAIE